MHMVIASSVKKGKKPMFLSLLLESRKLLGWGKEWNGTSKYT